MKEHEARIAALQKERDLLKVQVEVSEKANLANQAALETMRQAIEELGKRLPDPQRRETQAELESLVEAKRGAAPSIRVPRLGDVTVDPETIFVLMPFSSELNPIYEVIQEAARAVGLRSFRADALIGPGSIMDQIFESIAKSGLIVADLTGRNQNVMYELGLAMAMGKETFLLSQALADVPFDLQHMRILKYNNSPSNRKALYRDLMEALKRYGERTIGQPGRIAAKSGL